MASLKQHLISNCSTRSVSNGLMKDKIYFYDIFNWNVNSNGEITVEPYVPASAGGQTIHMSETENENIVYSYDFFFDFGQPFYVDNTDNSVWMPTFVALGTLEYPGIDNLGSWNDTIITIYMMNEDYLTLNADPANIHGTLYSDGTIVFDDGFFYYYDIQINHYSNYTLQSTDTEWGTSYIIRNLSLVVPNAKHEFHDDYYDLSTSADTYMYQPDDTTLVVMNLWGLGNQGNVMYVPNGIHKNNFIARPKIILDTTELHRVEMVTFPFQRIIEINTDEYSTYYTFFHDFYNFDGPYDNAKPRSTRFCTITDGVMIEWGTNTIADFYTDGALMLREAPTGYYPGLYVGTYSDNKLYYIDSQEPDEPIEPTAPPIIEVTEGDDAYTFTGTPTEDGTVVYLFTFDPFTGEITAEVENPYIVPRTDEEQVIYLAAIADGSAIGKEYSNWVVDGFIIPAYTIRGDVNNDGVVDLHDVVKLNDYLTSVIGLDDINFENAALCDSMDSDTVSDIDLTALFEYVLNGIWIER